MKRGVVLFIITLLLLTLASAQDDPFADIGDVQLTQEAGLTPDSPFYFLETFFEDVFSGDDPESAIELKEEKIAELKEMIAQGKVEEARQALEQAQKYAVVLEKEVSPDIEKQARQSSKAIKDTLQEIQTNDPQFQELVDQHVETEEKIAIAAQISTKIKDLCEQLAKVDPQEYARVCRTDDDAPAWQRELDSKLTKEQQEEAKVFFEILSECFENPAQCRCTDISVTAFAQKCSEIAPLAADCQAGNQEACDKMDNMEDPVELLPPHLQDAMRAVEDKFRESEFEHHVPTECVKEGALTRESCMKIMFHLHAPPECQEALEKGEIDPSDEHEARKLCEQIMFEQQAPQECKDAGLDNQLDCDKYMFKLDSPQECVEAGLTGEGHDDWRKCDAIRFQVEAPQECLDAGLDGKGRNDWDECNKITFKLDAPEECHQFIDERDPWKKCQPLMFKMDAPQECLDAGLDGTGRDDWRECDKIRFKLDMPEYCQHLSDKRDPWRECEKLRFEKEAPEECHQFANARDPWRECDKIRDQFETYEHVECASDKLYICDETGYCDCVEKEEYEKTQEFTYDEFEEYNECKDGCNDECPDADRVQCVDGNKCECYYDDYQDEVIDEPATGDVDTQDEDPLVGDAIHDEFYDERPNEIEESVREADDQPEQQQEEQEVEGPEPQEESQQESGNAITGEVVRDIEPVSFMNWLRSLFGVN